MAEPLCGDVRGAAVQEEKLMSPKTLENIRALRSSILDEAVEHELPPRDRSPCALVRPPRTDADGEDGGDELGAADVGGAQWWSWSQQSSWKSNRSAGVLEIPRLLQ
ncbi:hypothetical protein ABZ686_11200 [Streptomyces sp. NPDC006992]|uniref:hypothetical protein n=1 Tax=Streptomyces sp. NPDC006992 TaxID=3155601 RepID=UPI0033EF8143